MAYRPNVALVLLNSEDHVLLCERSDWPGCWQFPQGGMLPHETPEEALAREVREEIGLEPDHYQVIARTGPLRYAFPAGYQKDGYEGQEQIYFLAELLPGAPAPRLEGAHPEFSRCRWVRPAEILLEDVPPMKREVYQRVLRDFFGASVARPSREDQ